MPRPFRSGTGPQPVLAATAVAVVLGGLLVASVGAAALAARAEVRGCDGYVTGASNRVRIDASGVVTGGVIGAERGACPEPRGAATAAHPRRWPLVHAGGRAVLLAR